MSISISGTAAASNAYDAMLLKRNFSRAETRRQNKDTAALLNVLDLRNELNFTLNLYMSRFKWEVSELNASPHYIEFGLFHHGLMAFYKDSKLGWIILPATISRFNVYGEPAMLQLTGNGYNVEVDYHVNSETCVLLRDNPIFSPPILMYRRYATLIADVGRTCEVYVNAMKKPVTYIGDFSDKKSYQQLFDNTNDNEMATFIDISALKNKHDDASIKDVINNFQTDHNANDLKGIFMHRQSLFNEMLARMGIEASFVHKAAQVSSEEINKNDLMCQIILRQASDCRAESVARMAEISGLNIECESIIDMTQIRNAEIENNSLTKPTEADDNKND